MTVGVPDFNSGYNLMVVRLSPALGLSPFSSAPLPLLLFFLSKI